MGIFDSIGKIFKGVAKAVTTVAKAITNPIGTMIDLGKSIYEGIKSLTSGSSAPAASLPPPNSVLATPTSGGSSSSSGGAASLMNGIKAPDINAYGDLSKPENLAKYQADQNKYTQMLNMVTSIMQAEHDQKMAIIRNFKA